MREGYKEGHVDFSMFMSVFGNTLISLFIFFHFLKSKSNLIHSNPFFLYHINNFFITFSIK
jgi:hypothetical protein